MKLQLVRKGETCHWSLPGAISVVRGACNLEVMSEEVVRCEGLDSGKVCRSRTSLVVTAV